MEKNSEGSTHFTVQEDESLNAPWVGTANIQSSGRATPACEKSLFQSSVLEVNYPRQLSSE